MKGALGSVAKTTFPRPETFNSSGRNVAYYKLRNGSGGACLPEELQRLGNIGVLVIEGSIRPTLPIQCVVIPLA